MPLKKRPLRRIFLLVALALVVTLGRGYLLQDSQSPSVSGSAETSGLTLEEAARAQRSEVMLTARGRVQRTLADDNEGSRHQRFILESPSGHTVLVAHNIDLAPRVPLGQGDQVEIRGQYEWNERGGVLHWTHHDPAGRHAEGWIRHEGQIYE
jgi:hypothetical protein|nr:DUF3465 domain-containing protein [Candidatus Krumholzibacteria bacterium]